MAMVLTFQKPTQRNRFGKIPEDLSGSTLERGMCEKKQQELGRPYMFLLLLKRQYDKKDLKHERGNLETETSLSSNLLLK